MSHEPPPPPPTSPYGQPAPQEPPPQTTKGFFGALFDFSFQHFVTPMLVKAVYILSLVALVIVWLFWLVAAFGSDSAGLGIVVLLLGPVVLLIYLAIIRMTLEFYLSVVRMSQDIHHRLPG